MPFFNNVICKESYTFKSPNAEISVDFWLISAGEPFYSLSNSDSMILKQSKLGIIRTDNDFSTNLILDSVSNAAVAIGFV
jgi:hypothetical protein